MVDARDPHSELSLENAQRQSQQRLRVFGPAVLSQLDAESELAIEINGVSVGNVLCMDSALAELAAGWALIHRFLESPLEFDVATSHTNRAAVMIRGGTDISHRRGVLLGERHEPIRVPEPWPRDEEWTIPDDILLDVLSEAWNLFREDRMIEGSIHAALANQHGVEVVAFDITTQNAVAKVLGWCLIHQRLPAYEIMIVNGLITRPIVDAAARLGVKIIASPNVPTADAFKTSRVAGMSLIGYMRNQTVGMFGDVGLVTFEEQAAPDI